MNMRIRFPDLVTPIGIAALVLSSCGTTPRIRTKETISYPAGIREKRLEIAGETEFKKNEKGGCAPVHGQVDDPYNISWWVEKSPDLARLDTPV